MEHVCPARMCKGMSIWIRKYIPALVLLLVSSSLSLVGAEILVRLAYPDPFKNEHDKLFCHDAYYGWQFCKDVVGRVVNADYDHIVRTGSNGQRDFGGIDPQKNNIVVLGDSFTSNLGIENTSDVFTEVLERRLSRYNVINLGVNGYGTTQEYLKLKRAGGKYNPDIVILMFYIRNDFYDNVGLLDWVKGYERPLFIRNERGLKLTNVPVPAPALSLRDVLVRHSRLAALTRVALLQTNVGQWIRKKLQNQDVEQRKTSAFDFRETPVEVVLASEDDRIQDIYDITCDILSMISTELRQNQVEFYVFVIPSIFQVRDDYFRMIERFGLSQTDRFKPNELLQKCGEEKEIQVVDLAPMLIAAENNHAAPYLYFPREHHWTVSGNRMVADYIYDTLMGTSAAIRRGVAERVN